MIKTRGLDSRVDAAFKQPTQRETKNSKKTEAEAAMDEPFQKKKVPENATIPSPKNSKDWIKFASSGLEHIISKSDLRDQEVVNECKGVKINPGNMLSLHSFLPSFLFFSFAFAFS